MPDIDSLGRDYERNHVLLEHRGRDLFFQLPEDRFAANAVAMFVVAEQVAHHELERGEILDTVISRQDSIKKAFKEKGDQ